MTLDAGGTNFVYSAIQGNLEIVPPVIRAAQTESLDFCLQTIIEGFEQVIQSLKEKPAAISFAFPGPADYSQGIIGNCPNLACFQGGIPLGSILEEKFGLPVFINNDGDLFVYGEAIGGLLPNINRMIADEGSGKLYQNLLGITLGTGFGAGLVVGHRLHRGDNSAAAEIWAMRHPFDPAIFLEEGASIRAVCRMYAESAGIRVEESPAPEEIFKIAKGVKEGNQKAAIQTFSSLGQVIGCALANIVSVVDGLVVIGGGLSGAHELFMPSLISEMNRPLYTIHNNCRIPSVLRAFNLNDPDQLTMFVRREIKKIPIPGSTKHIIYHPGKQIGVGISAMGTSRAVGIGAYTFALDFLDKNS